jgi:phosphonate transport system substrate-binding protein
MRGSFVVSVLIFLLVACGSPNYPHVRLAEPPAAPVAAPVTGAYKLPLRVAVAAVISPAATLEAYGPLMDYLAARLDRPVQLLQRRTYAEINEMLRSGQADVAFVCGGAFVEGERDFGMELLVAPQVRGQTVYRAYLIVSRADAARTLADLRGRAFAFTDPLSNSGRLALEYRLWLMGERPDTFFSQVIFTYSHDNSIRAVADGVVDAAVVDSLVYDYTVARDPRYSGRTKVIERSPFYGIPPVVVHPQLNPQLKEEVRAALLGMHTTEQGRAALAHLLLDRFVPVQPDAYATIRAMAAQLRHGEPGAAVSAIWEQGP